MTNVMIVGGGAIGVGLAAKLEKANINPLIVGRSGPIKHNPRVKLIDSKSIWEYRGTQFQPNQADIVFFTTKSFDLEFAINQWVPLIHIKKPLIFLCNGFIEKTIQTTHTNFPEHKIRQGIASFGSKFDESSECFITTHGQVIWGSQTEDYTIEEKSICSADILIANDIDKVIRRKWLANMVLNTICAAYKLQKNKDIFDHPKAVEKLISESIALGKKLWPNSWDIEEWEGKKLVLDITNKTATNLNSMAADIFSGRKTEVEYLSGLAKEYGGAREFPLLTKLSNKIENQSSRS